MFDAVGRLSTPNWKLRAAGIALFLTILVGLVWILRVTQMPLRSYRGPLAPPSHEQADLENRLSAHVRYLSESIGERNLPRAGSLRAAEDYLRRNLQEDGYTVTEQKYAVDGQTATNLEVRIDGGDSGSGAIVVGAHYDSVVGAPGANDNASGVAAVLELARLMHGVQTRRSIRFVLFVNEEPPYFQTNAMGSLVYAKQLHHDRIPVVAMISLETIGYYSDKPGSQRYPPVLSFFYPSRGDFIGFVGNTNSRDLVRRAIRKFRETARFPSEGIAAPPDWPGIAWSDQWSFWQQDYPAIMITDTAFFRYPYYHTPRDTASEVDFARMARVVDGVRSVVESLATAQ